MTKEDYYYMCDICNNCRQFDDCNGDPCDAMERFEELVNKDTPKEVEHFGMYWKCPNCGEVITAGDKYCRRCGQALKEA